MIIREGMNIPADGIVVEGSEITTDESAMTGETGFNNIFNLFYFIKNII